MIMFFFIWRFFFFFWLNMVFLLLFKLDSKDFVISVLNFKTDIAKAYKIILAIMVLITSFKHHGNIFMVFLFLFKLKCHLQIHVQTETSLENKERENKYKTIKLTTTHTTLYMDYRPHSMATTILKQTLTFLSVVATRTRPI